MSCLTRQMQQRLTHYLRQHNEMTNGKQAEDIRNELVLKGLCPSDVTADQVNVILRSAQGC
jgi:hypothetical protein